MKCPRCQQKNPAVGGLVSRGSYADLQAEIERSAPWTMPSPWSRNGRPAMGSLWRSTSILSWARSWVTSARSSRSC